MFKNLIAPVQLWLLSQKRCVGCGSSLEKAPRRQNKALTIVTCRCGRIFVNDPKKGSYRRALFSEVK